MRISTILLVGLMTCFGGANADELAEREQIMRMSAEAFLASDFARIEEQAAYFRATEERTESGTWKLNWFHKGIFETAMDFDESDEANWSASLAKIVQWSSLYPDSPTPIVAYAGALTTRAWKVRGADYAYKVDKNDMRIFTEYMVEAAEYMTANMNIGSKDPYWYVQVAMTMRALGVNKEDFLAFMEEGFERYPNFDELYFTTVGFLTPKWHGSREEVAAFAQSVRARTREDRGNELYARVYWAAGSVNGRSLVYDPPADWVLALRSMDEILLKYPSQWNVNKFAFFACYKTDIGAAEKYMSMIEEPVYLDIWYDTKNYEQCKKIVQRR